MSLFGEVLYLPNGSGTIVFIAVMIFLTVFEGVLHFLEVECGKRGYKGLIKKLYREFMIMGFISFAILLGTDQGGDYTDNKWYLSFHLAHIVILFIGITFLVQSVLLVSLISFRNKTLLAHDASNSEGLIMEYLDMYQGGGFFKWCFYHGPITVPFPELREKIEYKILQEFFVHAYNLPREFKYANYMCQVLQTYIISLVEVRPVTWLLLVVLIVVNFLRIQLVDPWLQSAVCSTYPSSTTAHHYGESYGQHVCEEFTLRYMFILLMLLLCYLLGVFAASEIYIQRLVDKVLDDEETLEWLEEGDDEEPASPAAGNNGNRDSLRLTMMAAAAAAAQSSKNNKGLVLQRLNSMHPNNNNTASDHPHLPPHPAAHQDAAAIVRSMPKEIKQEISRLRRHSISQAGPGEEEGGGGHLQYRESWGHHDRGLSGRDRDRDSGEGGGGGGIGGARAGSTRDRTSSLGQLLFPQQGGMDRLFFRASSFKGPGSERGEGGTGGENSPVVDRSSQFSRQTSQGPRSSLVSSFSGPALHGGGGGTGAGGEDGGIYGQILGRNRRHLYLRCLERMQHNEHEYHQAEARRMSVDSTDEAFKPNQAVLAALLHQKKGAEAASSLLSSAQQAQQQASSRRQQQRQRALTLVQRHLSPHSQSYESMADIYPAPASPSIAGQSPAAGRDGGGGGSGYLSRKSSLREAEGTGSLSSPPLPSVEGKTGGGGGGTGGGGLHSIVNAAAKRFQWRRLSSQYSMGTAEGGSSKTGGGGGGGGGGGRPSEEGRERSFSQAAATATATSTGGKKKGGGGGRRYSIQYFELEKGEGEGEGGAGQGMMMEEGRAGAIGGRGEPGEEGGDHIGGQPQHRKKQQRSPSSSSSSCLSCLASQLLRLLSCLLALLRGIYLAATSHHLGISQRELEHGKDPDIKQLQAEFDELFLGGRPELYYFVLEFGLLLQCFYIAMWATNGLTIAQGSYHPVLWHLALTLPLPLNFFLLKQSIYTSALLKSIVHLDQRVANKIFEEAVDERNVSQRLRKVLRQALKRLGVDRKAWLSYLKEVFLGYAAYDGSVGSSDFQAFLHSLQIYLTEQSVSRLFMVIDTDKDGKIAFDKLSPLVFPDLQKKKIKFRKCRTAHGQVQFEYKIAAKDAETLREQQQTSRQQAQGQRRSMLTVGTALGTNTISSGSNNNTRASILLGGGGVRPVSIAGEQRRPSFVPFAAGGAAGDVELGGGGGGAVVYEEDEDEGRDGEDKGGGGGGGVIAAVRRGSGRAILQGLQGLGLLAPSSAAAANEPRVVGLQDERGVALIAAEDSRNHQSQSQQQLSPGEAKRDEMAVDDHRSDIEEFSGDEEDDEEDEDDEEGEGEEEVDSNSSDGGEEDHRERDMLDSDEEEEGQKGLEEDEEEDEEVVAFRDSMLGDRPPAAITAAALLGKGPAGEEKKKEEQGGAELIDVDRLTSSVSLALEKREKNGSFVDI